MSQETPSPQALSGVVASLAGEFGVPGVAGLGLLPGDQYIVTSGGLKGQRGFFTRGPDGQVTAADLAGRKFTRGPAAQE